LGGGALCKKDRTSKSLHLKTTRRRETGFQTRGQKQLRSGVHAPGRRQLRSSGNTALVDSRPKRRPFLATVPVSPLRRRTRNWLQAGRRYHSPVPTARFPLWVFFPSSGARCAGIVSTPAESGGNYPVYEATIFLLASITKSREEKHIRMTLRFGAFSPSDVDWRAGECAETRTSGRKASPAPSTPENDHDSSVAFSDTWVWAGGKQDQNEARLSVCPSRRSKTSSRGPGGGRRAALNIPGVAFSGSEAVVVVEPATEIRH